METVSSLLQIGDQIEFADGALGLVHRLESYGKEVQVLVKFDAMHFKWTTLSEIQRRATICRGVRPDDRTAVVCDRRSNTSGMSQNV